MSCKRCISHVFHEAFEVVFIGHIYGVNNIDLCYYLRSLWQTLLHCMLEDVFAQIPNLNDSKNVNQHVLVTQRMALDLCNQTRNQAVSGASGAMAMLRALAEFRGS